MRPGLGVGKTTARKSRPSGDGGGDRQEEMIEDIKQKLDPRDLRAMVLGHVIESGRSMKMD